MTKLTPLEHDLMRNAHERLHKWVEDTIMRCEVVDLSRRKQISIIFSCIADMLAEIAVGIEMPFDTFQECLREVYRVEVENNSRKVKERD